MPTCARRAALLLLVLLTLPLAAGEPRGNALHFASSQNIVRAGSLALTLPATIECWARPDTTGETILGSDDGANHYWYLFENVGGGLHFHSGISATNEASQTVDGVLPNGRWSHIAVVLSALGDATFYIDGEPVAEEAGVDGTHSAVPASPFAIGNYVVDPVFPFLGALDEVRVWSVARTHAQIQATMGTALTGAEAGLVSYHRFNQGTAGAANAGVVTATATTGTDGTLSGFALTGTTSNWIAAGWLNAAPTLDNAIPDQAAIEDVAFAFTFAADTFADADAGDTLVYTATRSGGSALPAWLTFTAATRSFAGTPDEGDVETIGVRVTASDGVDSVSDDFDLVVSANDAPTVAIPIPDQAATEDVAFAYAFPAGTFADADADDTLTYAATLPSGAALPGWLAFDGATRAFAGTPLNADVGDLTVRVTASDGAASASDDFVIAVANVNDAPVVATPIPDRTAIIADHFTAVIPAGAFLDVDAGDTLAYTATLTSGAALPAWLSFDGATRTFSGTPDALGPVAVRVTATDLESAAVSDDFTITVRPVPDRASWVRRRWDDATCGSGSGLALVLLAVLALGQGFARRDGGRWKPRR